MVSHTLPIGSISSGTMREEDLVPCFLSALEDVDPDRANVIAAEYHLEDDEQTEDDLCYACEALFDALDEHCPDYCYFGAHEGDGSDYGVWISWDSLNDDCRYGEVLKVDDLSDVPDGHSGHVLHVNDHGNATLYMADNGRLTEIWAVV